MSTNNYQGEHSAPDPENGAPMHNLKGVYPDDIHQSMTHAVKHYGEGDGTGKDQESIAAIHSAKDRPNRGIKIYRAVPKVMTHADQLGQLHLEKWHYMKYGKPHPSTESKLTGSAYYNKLHDDYAALEAKGPQGDDLARPKIQKGDWVSPSKKYATEHGRDNLNNKYRIISKTVKAKELYTDGNSIHEWGYHPHTNESTGYPVADIYLNEVMDIE